MSYKIDMTATPPADWQFDDVTPATDDAIATEFYGDEPEVHYDDIPAWLEEDVEYKNRREETCVFCRREGIEPPAAGSYATGSYRQDTGYGLNRAQPFRGNVCDMHHDTIEWVSFKWR